MQVSIIDTLSSQHADQMGQNEKILHSESRPATSYRHMRIRRKMIRPADGNRDQSLVVKLDRHSRLSPMLFGDNKTERPAAKRVKRMDDPDVSRIALTTCI